MSGKLSGKVAIITGGAGGLGKGIVERFKNDGADVILADFVEEVGKKTAEELKVEFFKCDVTSREDWEAVVKFAHEKFGKIDAVVNNAGWTYSNKVSEEGTDYQRLTDLALQSTLEVTDAEFDKVFAVNVKAIYYSANAVVPYMQKQGQGGSFVTIASTAGIRPRGGLTWYNATKAAVINATKSMAVEYAKDNIRFNNVCPVVALGTGLTSSFLGHASNESKFMATIPLGRGSTPKDIGNACAFLCYPESNFLTGIDIPVDGGRCV
ncbi:hypothetical protein LTR35_002625 [Friedmanniomyces endolithicus]|uniref:4-formylbenzenesulfonate dehydrogenase TsaC1/TsaC2 n=1 Tax=Friedmanniomyces endolithicus TaxID=329885 RepID=A0AAN6FTG3_9PEZI|nr:hypothetical protein LTR35_002625 [Friedmanniomyces endolithicus]KAK0291395.1 hypothetical protein LTS00_008395 [Friedmanniomyces endolithicus]KAK0323576.1 hypothetical protein LTR82_005323 [Friedmanniomyces endolithicus]KAK1019507.1 hypothetical protein LTR54_000149 [Friedmanniomyces endolithicus]